jgi:DNA-damage-inducible protein D
MRRPTSVVLSLGIILLACTAAAAVLCRTRRRVTNANKALTSAAKGAGVQRYAIFQDAGYKGLYGELGAAQVKARKGLRAKDDLFDRAGRAELAANEFRITQTEQKLVREHVKGERAATDTHREVGTQVRRAIERIGGTMPENLPVEDSIKKIEARRRAKAKTIARAPRDLLEAPR